MGFRIGSGIDVHQLVEGRELWLGGICIPHHKGSFGHSDADALLHAICDALLGALSLGDIGTHFPDSDPEYKNIDSKILLSKTYQLIKEKQYRVVNIDSTLCLENPKINKYIHEMRTVIASLTETGVDDISIKATTSEKLGYVGREEGVIAYASVLLESI
jgi:2-C-methyl-D-erythritol 2,4-cyclodiphosphate synthase